MAHDGCQYSANDNGQNIPADEFVQVSIIHVWVHCLAAPGLSEAQQTYLDFLANLRKLYWTQPILILSPVRFLFLPNWWDLLTAVFVVGLAKCWWQCLLLLRRKIRRDCSKETGGWRQENVLGQHNRMGYLWWCMSWMLLLFQYDNGDWYCADHRCSLSKLHWDSYCKCLLVCANVIVATYTPTSLDTKRSRVCSVSGWRILVSALSGRGLHLLEVWGWNVVLVGYSNRLQK